MESLSPKVGPMSCSLVGFMLGLPSRRCNVNVQQGPRGFSTRVQHGSDFRRDLSGQREVGLIEAYLL